MRSDSIRFIFLQQYVGEIKFELNGKLIGRNVVICKSITSHHGIVFSFKAKLCIFALQTCQTNFFFMFLYEENRQGLKEYSMIRYYLLS